MQRPPRQHQLGVECSKKIFDVSRDDSIQILRGASAQSQSMLQKRSAFEREPACSCAIDNLLQLRCNNRRSYEPSEPAALPYTQFVFSMRYPRVQYADRTWLFAFRFERCHLFRKDESDIPLRIMRTAHRVHLPNTALSHWLAGVDPCRFL